MQKKPKDLPVMILCGGFGTRLRDVTELLPKPMVPVGEQPIVWHIMKTYAAFGVRRFILCLGYKREAFVDYFMNYHLRTADATIKLGHTPSIVFHGDSPESDWEVTLAGTGLDSKTGTRVKTAAKYLHSEDEDFFLTYGDGLSDIDLNELLSEHYRMQKQITLTAVHPEARFGALDLQDDRVLGFAEKPPHGEGYINGGFMVLKKTFVGNYIPEQDVFLEQTPMHKAAEDGQMGVYRHNGFWQCMDNQREYMMLNEMWNNKAPWVKYWN